MRNKAFSFHTICAIAIFVLGNAVILLPRKNANQFTLFCFLAVALISVLLYFLSAPVFEKLLSKTSKPFFVLWIALAVFSFWVAADAFKNSYYFISVAILPETSKALIILVYLAVVLFFSLRRQEEVLKFCLISFVFALVMILFFFLASFGKLQNENIIFSLPDLSSFISGAKPYFLNPFLSLLLLPPYLNLVFGKVKRKTLTLGLSFGFFLLGIAILLSVMIFGAELSGRLDYPFFSAVSTVTIGKLFTRMDYLAYFIYFSSALIKITICLFVTFSSLKKIRQCI